MADEIMDELWAIKDALAKEADYDVDKLVALIEARHRQRKEDSGKGRMDRPAETPAARR
jgi:hypothetical protein